MGCIESSEAFFSDHQCAPDLARALEVFDPVWASLAPREQARIIRLLIERVGYDGRDGTVTVTFRPPGIEALCRKAGLNGQEVMR